MEDLGSNRYFRLFIASKLRRLRVLKTGCRGDDTTIRISRSSIVSSDEVESKIKSQVRRSPRRIALRGKPLFGPCMKRLDRSHNGRVLAEVFQALLDEK